MGLDDRIRRLEGESPDDEFAHWSDEFRARREAAFLDLFAQIEVLREDAELGRDTDWRSQDALPQERHLAAAQARMAASTDYETAVSELFTLIEGGA